LLLLQIWEYTLDKQDGQCLYSVTLGHVRATTVAVEMQQVLHISPLNAELNPICHLLALLEARHIPHVSRIRVKCVCVSVCVCM